ncbi:DUF1236 domain-containing protein [Mycoplana rhizolycopersici]|jgi:hypothetical protein|uniref:DUF1236 domain-containing protein n=1 Tax=Mycoplana rhizolycopersici TaxID=2746702 RepID=A0ABX2QAQ9_9HYPH|nr:DUF1236 domain-containing protein [Rhizobium rhizolycopersici]NVP54820.1 DUF1236 domain-containing protein [Rhizobium rhizolycopersici]
MKKVLIAGVALVIAGTAMAHAEEKKPNPAIGAATGGATGALTGALIGGPVGAAIGGVAGATLGAAASVPQEARTYVIEHPVEPVILDGPVSAETRLREDVVLTPIPEHPDLGYVYVENRPVIVRTNDRQVIYVDDVQTTGSIAPAVPETTITYIERHPVGPVVLEGPVAAGTVVPDDVDIVAVPDSPDYGYIYVDERPVLIERSSRKVLWVR